jgi:hypothetical protein
VKIITIDEDRALRRLKFFPAFSADHAQAAVYLEQKGAF